MLAWLGDLFIVAGLWGVGSQYRPAFLASLVGESLWIAHTYSTGDWALRSICFVFFVMALRGYILWGDAAKKAKVKELEIFQAGFRRGLAEGKRRGETD